MTEITVADHTYRIGRLSARQQFDLMRKLGKTLDTFAMDRLGIAATMNGARFIRGFANGSLADMKQSDSDFVLDLCLSVVSRRSSDGPKPSWAGVSGPNGRMMFEDIGVMEMMELSDAVIQENLGDFFEALRAGIASVLESETGPETGAAAT